VDKPFEVKVKMRKPITFCPGERSRYFSRFGSQRGTGGQTDGGRKRCLNRPRERPHSRIYTQYGRTKLLMIESNFNSV